LPAQNTNGVKVAGVTDNDDSSTAIFYTRNVTPVANGPWTTNATPLFGNRGFVVFHKGGDGAVFLLPKQLSSTNLLGNVSTNTSF